MKTSNFVAYAIMMALMALSLTACNQGMFVPETPKVLVNLPEGVSMNVSIIGDNEAYVYYTYATVSGNIVFEGNPDLLPNDYFSNISVIFNYGTERENLSSTARGVAGDPKTEYWRITVPFKADIRDLDDGAVYYFNATVSYGSDKKETKPVKFFTLPKGPVDLDLKSGNLWASSNLGADYPHDGGAYYAWGESEAKSGQALYDWTFYKWCNGTYTKLTKYCTNKFWGYNDFVDNKTMLELEDDAAHKALGGNWHIPSAIDWTELNENCGWTGAVVNDVRGWLVRSKSNPDDNKKVIFLPCHGYYDGGSVRDDSYNGYYWTSNLAADRAYDNKAYNFYLNCYLGTHAIGYGDRCCGENIRPVLSKQ